MPKILYEPHRFQREQRELIDKVNEIVENYRAQGFVLSLRQVYYAMVSRALIPNTQRSYKRLGTIIDGGRLAGLIDWSMIEDRTRNVQSRSHFDRPQDVMNAAYHSYRLDRWANQTCRVECWIEKDALAGVFLPVCRKWDVPLFPCRGYVSQSEMWRAAMRLKQYHDNGQTPFIIHFGDHDPSGIDMTRDIQDRMRTFGCQVNVERLALNIGQVRQYNPPNNPAKTTDARFQAYMRLYGDKSWELDALEPTVLSALVEDAIEKFRDPATWRETVEREIEERAVLKTIAEKWSDVEHHVQLEMPTAIVQNEDALEADEDYQAEMEER